MKKTSTSLLLLSVCMLLNSAAYCQEINSSEAQQLDGGTFAPHIVAALGAAPVSVPHFFAPMPVQPHAPQSPTAHPAAPSPVRFGTTPTTTSPVHFGTAQPTTTTSPVHFGTAQPTTTTSPVHFGTAQPTTTTSPVHFGTAQPTTTTSPVRFGTAQPSASSPVHFCTVQPTATSSMHFAPTQPSLTHPPVNSAVARPSKKQNSTASVVATSRAANKSAKKIAKQVKVLTEEEKAALLKAAAEKKAKLEAEKAIRIITSVSYQKKEGSDEKWVALTFDDGPTPVYTTQVLALLKSYGIHATFCLIGRQVKKYPELVEQIVAEGHKIAVHSMNHDERLAFRPDKKIKQEILGEKELIQSIVPAASIDFYRAPGGVWNRHLRELVNSWGMKSLGWSVDSKDWQQPGVDSIISTVEAELHSGGVVLMHDAGGDRSQTIEALKRLIPKLKKDGYQFGFPGANGDKAANV